MPIRIEHQPSAFAVGVAGYAAGRGAARERQGKYALDLWQDQQRMQNQQNLLNQRNQWLDDRDAKSSWETMPTLSKIPDWVDAQTRKELADMATAIRDTRKKFGWDDPNARQTDQDLIGKYEDAISRLSPPDAGEAASRNWGYLNPKTGKRAKLDEQPEEGMVLWDYKSGGPVYDDSREREAAKQQQAEAEKKRQAEEKEYATVESNRNSWLTRRSAIAEKMRESNDARMPADQISESQIMENATKQMAAEGWGQEPRLPTLRPGEKPHMGSPALGPEITPLSPEEAAMVGGGTTGNQPIVVTPDMMAEPVPIPWQGGTATPGAAAALRDPNTRAMPIPTAPVGGMQPQASGRPFVTENTPVIGDWVGDPMQQPSREPQDPEVQVVPYGKPTTEPRVNMPQWEQGANIAGLSPTDIAQYQDYEAGASPMSLPTAPRPQPDWAAEAWPEPINASGQPITVSPSADRVAEVMPKITAGMQQQRLEQFTPEMLPQARRIAQTPAGRAALQELYGVDFAMPEEPQAALPPLDTTARQHVEAMRGPQGTGEGIPSDAERIAGSVQGAGSLAGRTAGYARRDAGQLGPGQTRTTKYNITPTADEREAAMNARWERANQMQQEREMMARASGIDPNKTGSPRPKPSASDVAGNLAKRKADVTGRSNAVAARGIGEGIDRSQRLGKSVPVVQRAIRAAVMGDVAAQKALDERGIKWRA